MMESSKPWYYKIIAIFVVILVLASLVAFSFAVPWTTVHAESVQDELEDYLDNMYGEGATELIQGISGNVPGLNILTAVMTGLEFVEVMPSNAVSVNSLSTLQGYYLYNGERHLCTSTVDTNSYSPSDGGRILAKSDLFEIRATVTINTSWDGVYAYCGPVRNNRFVVGYDWSANGYTTYTWDIIPSGSIFSGSYNNTFTGNYYITTGLLYGVIPTLTDNTSITPFIGKEDASSIAGGFAVPKFNWSDLGFDSTVTIDPNDTADFVLNVFNPWIEEEYPDLTVYLFYPDEDTTDSTDSSGGCHCQVYVYVTEYFDPEINVYVTEYITVENNVEVELPSDWLQDYTLTTDPYEVETIPFPTDESQEVTMPTLDVEDYEETYGNAIDFWFYVAQCFIEKLHLQLILAFAFALSVVGFVLWKLGGGGKE